jgi:PAS domain S-box-containing protein
MDERRLRNGLPQRALQAAAVLLAATAFWMDCARVQEGAGSILYLGVLYLVSLAGGEMLVRRASIGCIGLAAIAWALVSGRDPFLAGLLRLALACAAMGATGLLLVHRKRFERMRREMGHSQVQLHNFMNSVPQILWRARPDAVVDLFNQRYADIVGRDLPAAITADYWLQDFHPDDREQGWAAVQHALATGTDLHARMRLRHASGDYRWMSLDGRPTLDADGKLRYFYGGSTDIHEEVTAVEEAQRLRAELEASQAELLNFLDSVPQVLWRASMAPRIEFYNRRYTEATGRDWRIVVENQDWIDDFHPDDREWFLALLHERMAAGKEIRAVHRLRFADGSYRWMSLIGLPLHDEQGKVVRYYGGSTDVHEDVLVREELLRTREALERSRAELENFADSVPQIQWRLNSENQVDYLNRRYTELTGHSREEAIEKQNWADLYHPDDLDGAWGHLRKAAESGEDRVSYHYRLRHRDQRYRWMRLSGRAIRSPETGQIEWWYGGTVDAHEEVLAQQRIEELLVTLEQRVADRTAELLRTEARYASLFEVSSMTFAEMDFSAVQPTLAALRQRGVADLRAYLAARPAEYAELLARIRTVRVNGAFARLLGYADLAELVARPPTQNAADGDDILLRQLEMAFNDADHLDGRAVLIGKDGEEVPVYYNVYRLPGGLHLSSHIDLTEQDRIESLRRATQEELGRANRVATVGAFSASIAHELNQPIASMVLDAQTGLRWLQRETPEVAAAEKVLERLARTARRTADIVQRTRNAIVAGRRQVQTLELGTLIADTRDILEADLRRAEISLTMASPPEPLAICGDPVELQQVLINLINNAADALRGHPGERTIRLVVKGQAAGVSVAVEDTGPGLPDDDVERLFEPFFTTKAAGIGMGLQICRSVIDGLGGTLRARNGPQGGACFTFTLPWPEPPDLAAADPAAS